jgi:hypothetical protein
MPEIRIVFKKIEVGQMHAAAALISQLNREGVYYDYEDTLNDIIIIISQGSF